MSENSKNNKNINISHEVTEDTKRLMITKEESESQNIKFFKADKPKYGGFNINKVGIIRPPECVVINLINYPGLKLENLEVMPKNLPNLAVLSIQNLSIKSLQGISKKLPNLKSLGFINLKLKSLSELPKFLPELKGFGIVNTPLKSLKNIPKELPSLERLNINNVPLESLQYLPESLPNLEKFTVIQTNIQTLEYFPPHTPILKEIHLLRNKLVSLKGLPPEIPLLKSLHISHNKLTSLEHLPYKFEKRKLDYRDKERLKYNLSVDSYNLISFMVDDNPIRTLAGIKFPRFFNKLIGIYNTGPLYDNGFFAPFDIKNQGLQLCPTGLKLIRNYYKKKIEVETLELNMNTGEKITSKMVKDPARYDAIVEFYRKTPMELAQQYIENPNSLSDGEIERLGWEGGYQERQLLESNLPADHALLKEISQRLSHQLPSGLTILK